MLHGTDTDLWQREFNRASLIISGNISPEVETSTFNASNYGNINIRCVSRYTCSLSAEECMEQHLFIGKTGVRSLYERIVVMSFCLPLCPDINGIHELELTNLQKHATL
jgi:hypothetical protein